MANRLLQDCQGRAYGPLRTIGVIASAAILVTFGLGMTSTLLLLSYHFGIFVVWVEPIEAWDEVRRNYSIIVGVLLFGSALRLGWWAYRFVTNGSTYCRITLCRVHTRWGRLVPCA